MSYMKQTILDDLHTQAEVIYGVGTSTTPYASTRVVSTSKSPAISMWTAPSPVSVPVKRANRVFNASVRVNSSRLAHADINVLRTEISAKLAKQLLGEILTSGLVVCNSDTNPKSGATTFWASITVLESTSKGESP